MTSQATLDKLSKIHAAAYDGEFRFSGVCFEIASGCAANLDALTEIPARDVEVGQDAQKIHRALASYNRPEVSILIDAMKRMTARFAVKS